MKLKHILTLSLCLLLFGAKAQVMVRITDGAPNATLQSKMERNLADMLDELNAAYDSDSEPNYSQMHMSPEAQQTISLLWNNSHILCIEDAIVQNCLTKKSGGATRYQIRNIPLLLTSGGADGYNSEDEKREAVVTFDGTGKIVDFNLTINQNQYADIFKKNLGVKDHERRELIVSWTERFMTAYNEFNIDFIKQMFSEDALIITGRVVKPTTERRGDVKFRSDAKIVYDVKNKKQYISDLSNLFDRYRGKSYKGKPLYHIDFDEVKVMRHPNPEYSDYYGVTLKQRCKAGNYSDVGYLFLLWDFTDPDRPMIHVRTWQPDQFNGAPLPEDQRIDISTFDGLVPNL